MVQSAAVYGEIVGNTALVTKRQQNYIVLAVRGDSKTFQYESDSQKNVRSVIEN